MAQPPAYNPSNVFANDVGRSGLQKIDPAKLDSELTALSASIQALRANLAQIQTDEGHVLIDAVSLTSSAIAVIAAAVGVVQGPAGPTGPQGIQGPQGVAGPTGATGPAGPTGSTGAQGPQGIQGLSFEPDAVGTFAQRSNFDAQAQGFAYLATDLAQIYYRLGVSGWSSGISWGQGPTGATGPQGPAGTNGTNGATWRTASGVPSNSLGVNGDFYLDSFSGTYYLKTSGAYVSQGSLRGAQGPQGPTGPAGATGPAGPVGAAGSTGATGATGATGPQGPQGIQGPQGPAATNAATALRLATTNMVGASGADITYQGVITGVDPVQIFRKIRAAASSNLTVTVASDGAIEIGQTSGVGGA